MDWTSLADRLAEGEKTWRAFRDGANVATQLGSLERARNELQAQYDALPGQIAQAKEELRMTQANGDRARAEVAQAAEAQRRDLAAAQAKRIAELQAEADAWIPKLTALKEQFQATLAVQQSALGDLETKISAAKQQVTELEAIRASLKAQLQRVA